MGVTHVERNRALFYIKQQAFMNKPASKRVKKKLVSLVFLLRQGLAGSVIVVCFFYIKHKEKENTQAF